MSSDPSAPPLSRPRTGGTPAPTPDTLAHPVLKAHGQAIAEAATHRFYRVWPELLARYGERGREHTYEDQYWHLAHLDAAFSAGAPKIFLDYVAWLRGFLNARGLGDDIVCANFVFLRESLAAAPVSLAEESARAAAIALLDAAVELFPELVRTPPDGG
jgi:hypothetical protein